MEKLTTQQIIEKAKKIHGNRYDYSETLYVDATKKIKIECKEHGFFLQRPHKHMAGQGCPLCAGHKLKTTKQFVEESNKVHKNQYGYNDTVYINSKSPVIITCQFHGNFEQVPNSHLAGRGCAKCSTATKTRIDNNKSTILAKMNSINHGRFEYDINDYKGYNHHMNIKCIKHDRYFKQSPWNFLQQKNGCVKCKIEFGSAGERKIHEYLDSMCVEYDSQFRFEDCKNVRPLPFDFYIKSLNVCIEFDGIQHFTSGSWGGDDALKLRQLHDSIKNEYCKNNDIKLIRIRYDEDVIKILEEKLKL